MSYDKVTKLLLIADCSQLIQKCSCASRLHPSINTLLSFLLKLVVLILLSHLKTLLLVDLKPLAAKNSLLL